MTADSQNENLRKLRLRRLNRIFAPSPIYFVTTCTFNRRAILARVAMQQRFLEFAEAGEAHGAYVGAYVIMPNHIHFFVVLEQDKELSAWMKSLKNSLSKTLRTLAVSPPHWQKGFFDHVLRSAESYSQKWEYVRDNPVRAGLTKTWKNGLTAAKFGQLNIARSSVGGHRPPLQARCHAHVPPVAAVYDRRGARRSAVRFAPL
ncbi:MAG: REP-associated tyrosine transposase [Chthoniobacterales bacterium]